ncbi:unnamed protein product [Caenorhabditis angaria]|uniref:Ku domain-containing protein n=1 Tax=Caenorhabditis angaria TaxID=860376 RepID=A0A9P1IJL8_9PELO|nr:unnamed protein product [Caenorhabditis angaria]
MDETKYGEDGEVLNVNKKYTFFVIDASEAMFESNKDGECDFKYALKLVLNEYLNICCNWTLKNQVGIIITNRENPETNDNFIVFSPMGIPGQEEVNEIRELLESENIKKEIKGESKTCDLANCFNFCKRQFSGFSNTRHQSVIYFTNNRNPFGRDDFWESSYFKRTKTAISKIIGIGQRKTLGEFSVILVPEDSYRPENREEKEKEAWYHLDTEVFTKECDSQRRIRQKTTVTRSHANVTVKLGPGVEFDVGVFTLVSEARPWPKAQKYLKSTEMPIEKNVGYVPVPQKQKGEFEDSDDDFFSSSKPAKPTISELKTQLTNQVIQGGEELRKRAELRKMVELGGEKVVLDSEEHKAMTQFAQKGIQLIGFCPIENVDCEISIGQPKLLRPNEETTLGSTRIYRALLDRCFARQQAMICKYQSRSNEKMRMVALIPWKKAGLEEQGQEGDDEDQKPDVKNLRKLRAQADASEFLQEGFSIVALPYREEMKSTVSSDVKWPEIEEQEKTVAKKFIKKLTMSYNPGFYENPRLLSERSALCERATGEELIERRDTLIPYHNYPERLQRVHAEIEQITQVFHLDEVGKAESKPQKKRKNEEDSGNSKNKKGKPDIKELYESGKLAKLTKDELLEEIEKNCKNADINKKSMKQDLVDFLTNYFENL